MSVPPDSIRIPLLSARVVRLAFHFLLIPPIVNRHSFVHCVQIVFGHPTFVYFHKLYSGSNVCSLAPNLIWVTSSIGLDAIQVFCVVFCGVSRHFLYFSAWFLYGFLYTFPTDFVLERTFPMIFLLD